MSRRSGRLPARWAVEWGAVWPLPAARARIAWAVLAAAACGPKPGPSEPSWLERDASSAHASATVHGPAAVTAAIDPARIDDMDEAAVRAALEGLGDREPAGKLALRAARLSHHRGDDAEAQGLLARAASAADAGEVAEAAKALERALVTAPVDPAL